MKAIRGSFRFCAIIGGLMASLVFIHAQTVNKSLSIGKISLDDPNVNWNAFSDFEVELMALEATTPLAAELVTRASGYYSAQYPNWPEGNESLEFMKPLILFGYQYNPTNHVAFVSTNFFTIIGGITNIQARVVTDPLELMPFVARPRSKAVGAQTGVGQNVNNGQVNLTTLGFTDNDYDHSGQFNRNIQTPQVEGFYSNLVSVMFPPF
jgi:hypothetical protein